MNPSACNLTVTWTFCILPDSEALFARDFADQENWVESMGYWGHDNSMNPQSRRYCLAVRPLPDESRPFTTVDRRENDHALEQDSVGCLGSCLVMDR